MEINRKTRIGDIVKANFNTAKIFEKNNIDFCCRGAVSLEDATSNAKIDINNLLTELEAIVALSDPDSKYIDSLELDELADYIEKRHHSYVSENIPFLQVKLQKLCDVHGDKHPELFRIKDLFDGAAENLNAHMKKEELILFPHIRKMVKIKKDNLTMKDELGRAREIINVMHKEHSTEGERFEEISKLSSSYTCPPDGCNTYQVTYQSLKDFEKDLHRHIHLENNILFKKALILEAELINY